MGQETEARRNVWKAAFLEALAKAESVAGAAKIAGTNRWTVRQERDKDPEFARQYKDALEQGTDYLESAAAERAVKGAELPYVYRGKLVLVGRDASGMLCQPGSKEAVTTEPLMCNKPSDLLVIFLLRARRPGKYRDNYRSMPNVEATTVAETKADEKSQFDTKAFVDELATELERRAGQDAATRRNGDGKSVHPDNADAPSSVVPHDESA